MNNKQFGRRDIPKIKFRLRLIFLILILGCFALRAGYNRIIYVLSMLFLIISIAFLKHKYFNLKDYMAKRKIVRILEDNFLELGIYTLSKDKNRIIKFPNIKVIENDILVKFENSIRIRKIIENNIELIGAFLPEEYQIKSIDLINNGIKISLKNGEKDRLIINDLDEYMEVLNNYNYNKIPLDKELDLDFKKIYHLAVSAKTGSGKSYFITYLIISLYLKGVKCVLSDFNGSLRYLHTICDYQSNKDEILGQIRRVRSCLDQRKANFEINKDYKRIVIFIEEYLSLISSLDKSEKKELESMISTLVSEGRKFNITVIIITQTAKSDVLDTQIRKNMNRLLIGRVDKSEKLTLDVNSSVLDFGSNILGQANLEENGSFKSFLTPTVDFDKVLKEINAKYENKV